MGILLHAKIIIILNCKNTFHTKQSSNCESISIIQTIYVDSYALLPYIIVKKMSFFLISKQQFI